MMVGHLVKSAYKYLTNPNYRFPYNANKGLYDGMPDKEYLSRQFRARLNSEMNWDNPITFNEKMQWLKINDRKPIYTQMVDKYLVIS